jgi:hypothetical protein
MQKEEKVVQFEIALGVSSIAIHVTNKLCPQLPCNLCLYEGKSAGGISENMVNV